MDVKGIVDRIEGEIVVIEIDGTAQDISSSNVDINVKAGDCVTLVNGKWTNDEIGTQTRSEDIKKLMDNVWED